MNTNHMKKELISIGLPTYNGEKYLEQAINSLRAQTYRYFELIISDDASTDATETICRKYAKRDKRISYTRQKRNLGFAVNFNYVLKKAKGNYFIWAGQDDYWDKRFTETLFKLIKAYPKAVLAMCNYQNVHGEKKYFAYKLPDITNKETRHESLLKFIYSRNLSYFYGLHKTHNLRKARGYHTDSRPIFKSSDYLTIFKVLLGGQMVYTSEVLFFKRDTGYYTEQLAIFEKFDLNRDVMKRIIRYFHFPIFYLYDLIYSTKYTIFFSFTLFEKTNLMIVILVDYLRNNLGFIVNILKGIAALIKGFLKKLATL